MAKKIFLCRHGETEWSATGHHTGRTNIALTPQGEAQAKSLKPRLQNCKFSEIWTSPLKRAHQTCQLAGFVDAKVVDDLAEWDYGDFEGKTTAEIRQNIPDWSVFRHGAQGGESIEQVNERAERIVQLIKQVEADLVIFSHGHFLRALAAKWLGMSVADGRFFVLSTASLSILGFERDQPVIELWNDNHHLEGI